MNIAAKTPPFSSAERNSFLRNQPTNCADSIPAETRCLKLEHLCFKQSWPTFASFPSWLWLHFYIKVKLKSALIHLVTDFMGAVWAEVLDACIFTTRQQFRPKTLVWTDVNGCLALEKNCLVVSSKDVTSAQHPWADSNFPFRKAIRNTWCLHVLPFSDWGFPSPVE